MKIKVLSDGTNIGTNIFDGETGKPIEDVVAFRFNIDCRERPSVISAEMIRELTVSHTITPPFENSLIMECDAYYPGDETTHHYSIPSLGIDITDSPVELRIMTVYGSSVFAKPKKPE